MTAFKYFGRIILSLLLICSVATIATAADKQKSIDEATLLNTLRTAKPAEKAIACKQLAIHGSKEAVPELADLLADEQLASWSRIALEAIPDPAVDEALQKAMAGLKGRLLVGVINSIGVRRSTAAVDSLASQLKNDDVEVASAAAVALGRIGTPEATKVLRPALAGGSRPVRTAVAEGCVLCAERLLAEGKSKEAADLYDAVRAADVAKPRILEATRGAILARQAAGIPLLVEQLRSNDKAFLQIGLCAARELPGREAMDALTAEVALATPDRAALLLAALADRKDFVVSPALLEVAKKGDVRVRIAAVEAIGRAGSTANLPSLLEIATEPNPELSRAAKTALANLSGENFDQEIIARLSQAQGKSLAALIDVAGERRIAATAPLMKALDQSDREIRNAALRALGETVGPDRLSVLISQLSKPKDAEDAAVIGRALQAACVRMPDRDACATQLGKAVSGAPLDAKVKLLEILGAMGGAKALSEIAVIMNMKGADEQLQDAGSRVLGQWMTVDAGPVLLDLANTSTGKYQTRALRGYIRLARQFPMSDEDRARMCKNALEAAKRIDEKKLVLAVLERYPNSQTLAIAINSARDASLKEEAVRVALAMAQKLDGKAPDAKTIVAQMGLDPVKLEVVKAQYGAGNTQKDVTAILQKQAGDSPLIFLPQNNYNASFGGDPVPNVKKELKVQYRINGQPGEATFAENAAILLPMPQ